MPAAAAIVRTGDVGHLPIFKFIAFFGPIILEVDIQRSLFYFSGGGLMPLRHMKRFACLLFLLPTLALAQDYLGQNHPRVRDRKSTRLNSSHTVISYAVFCLKKKRINK